jgi:small basic protein
MIPSKQVSKELNGRVGVRRTYSATVFVAASGAAVLATLVFAGTDDVAGDLNGTIILVFGSRLVLENAQPGKAICIWISFRII